MAFKYKTHFISANYLPTTMVTKRYDRRLKGDELSLKIEMTIEEKINEGFELFHLEVIKSVGKAVLHQGFHSTEGVLLTFRTVNP